MGLFVQMFLPDPKVQHTIEWLVEVKQKRSKSQSDSTPDKDED